MKLLWIYLPLGILIYLGGKAIASPVAPITFFIGVMTGMAMMLANVLVRIAFEAR